MRIINAMVINKEKLVHHYVDLTVKAFDKKSETTQIGGFECQLRTSKSGVCLDENWMFVSQGEEGSGGLKFRIFVWTS